MHSLSRFLRAERGATAIEYSVICAFIVIGIIAGCILIGQQISPPLDTASQAMTPRAR